MLDELKKRIKQGDVLFIVGTGVSIASAGVPCVSWKGLVKDGLNWCERNHRLAQLPNEARAPWKQYIEALLLSSSSDDLIRAASEVERLLDGPDSGDFGNWLRDSIGTVTAKNFGLLRAIADLELCGGRLATTNYDGLLENATGLRWVTWQAWHQASVQRVLRGSEKGIFHIHGFWREPESLIFSAHSYERVKADLHTRAILEAIQTLKTVVFVGVGSGGLSDPHFSRLMDWSRVVLKKSPYRRFLLCLNRECTRLWKDLQDTGITPVGYADEWIDDNGNDTLEQCLRGLHPGQEIAPLWRGFSAETKRVFIVPSQIEKQIEIKAEVVKGTDTHDNEVFEAYDYSHATAEMTLVKELEMQLAWFGIDTKQYLCAHLPNRWRTTTHDTAMLAERQHYLSSDESAFRGYSLVVLGSPTCNRVSDAITRQLLNRLAPTQNSTPLSSSAQLLKTIGDAFLRHGARFLPAETNVPEVRFLLPPEDSDSARLAQKQDSDNVPTLPMSMLHIGGSVLTWAVVIRTDVVLTHALSTEGGHKKASDYSKNEERYSEHNRFCVVLAGGASAEGTYASLCKEAQVVLSETLKNENIQGDFVAVFLVRVGIHPKHGAAHRRIPFNVEEVALIAVSVPRLGGDDAVDCSNHKWRRLEQPRWRILIACVGKNGDNKATQEVFQHHLGSVSVPHEHDSTHDNMGSADKQRKEHGSGIHEIKTTHGWTQLAHQLVPGDFDLILLLAMSSRLGLVTSFEKRHVALLNTFRNQDKAVPIIVKTYSLGSVHEVLTAFRDAAPQNVAADAGNLRGVAVSMVTVIDEKELSDALRFQREPTSDGRICRTLQYLYPEKCRLLKTLGEAD